MQAAKTQELHMMQARLDEVATEYQDYKLNTHKDSGVTSKAAKEREGVLLGQISALQETLQLQEDATKQQCLVAQMNLKNYVGSERQLSQLQTVYAKAAQDWRETLAHEKKKRTLHDFWNRRLESEKALWLLQTKYAHALKEVASLQSALQQQTEATSRQGEKAQNFWRRRLESERELSQVQKDYDQAMKELDAARRREQFTSSSE
jgi:hypothetical protein